MPVRVDFNCTNAELKRAIDDYFKERDENGEKYSIAGLCAAIDLPHRRFKTLMKIADEYTAVPGLMAQYEKDHKEDGIQWRALLILQKAALRVQAQLETRTDSMAIFQLKQPELGGYTEKNSTSSGDVKVSIKLDGAGKNPFG